MIDFNDRYIGAIASIKNSPVLSETSKPLENKVALVTGAASGIGRAVASAFALAGARVVFADRHSVGAMEAVGALRAAQTEAMPVTLDTASNESIDRAVADSVAAYGGVDILFNAAGVHHTRRLLDISPPMFQYMMSVNVFGAFYMLQACARVMIERGSGGKIINVASIAGREGRRQQLEYNVSKAAVISLTRTAALELIEHRIYVNAVAPGPIRTSMWDEIRRNAIGHEQGKADSFDRSIEEMVPAKRLGTPEDIVGAALFLASAASDYVVGQTLNVDGGMIMS